MGKVSVNRNHRRQETLPYHRAPTEIREVRGSGGCGLPLCVLLLVVIGTVAIGNGRRERRGGINRDG